MSRLNKAASSRSQINIKEVKDGVLVLPGKKYRMIVETSAVNFELKSEEEQDQIIDMFQNFLNSLPCPVQILIRTREVDIDGYLEEFMQHKSQEKEVVYKEQIDEYALFIKKLISGNKILSRKFFIVIPYTSENGKHDFSLIKEQLQVSVDIISKGLERMGMKTRTLGNLETLDLFYSFYNPAHTKSQPLTKKAIDFEVKRHTEILEKGETPVQETRGWDDTKSITYSQRVKENAHDYRYFPEPDIPPMVFEKLYLETVRKSIPELPIDKVARYKKVGVKESDAILLTRDVSTSSYFDQVCEAVSRHQEGFSSTVNQQVIANALINKKISADLTPDDFAARLIEMSKPKETDMGQLEKVVHEVIATNQKSVDDYRSGKTNAIMFLVGQVMKGMKGQADAGTVKTALEKALI
jgi:hypothetical protein